MRVDVEPIDLFLKLMRENRPCPNCGSSRITLSCSRADKPRASTRLELQAGGGALLNAECADCKRTAQLAEPAAH
jgi:hypothetical protein